MSKNNGNLNFNLLTEQPSSTLAMTGKIQIQQGGKITTSQAMAQIILANNITQPVVVKVIGEDTVEITPTFESNNDA